MGGGSRASSGLRVLQSLLFGVFSVLLVPEAREHVMPALVLRASCILGRRQGAVSVFFGQSLLIDGFANGCPHALFVQAPRSRVGCAYLQSLRQGQLGSIRVLSGLVGQASQIGW